MTEDYLWDRTGTPDADVASLERALAPLRYQDDRLRPLPARAATATRWSVRQLAIGAMQAAATLALVAYAGWFAASGDGNDAAWRVSVLGGDPTVNDVAIEGATAWRVGDLLETDGRSVAQIDVGEIGNVEVGPNSRVRLVRARVTQHRMALDEGRIRAVIWAPPGLFVVDTPSAVAVDLGCAYSLEVDAEGAGLLRVEHGWVGFRHGGRESFIPEGAMCATRRGHGPGTPYYEDAPAELIAALVPLDFGEPGPREMALTHVLSAARPRDAFTLWHLLTRTNRAERVRVFNRLSALAPPPQGVTLDGVLAGDQRMLDAWWNTLGLDTATWWRMWQAPWAR